MATLALSLYESDSLVFWNNLFTSLPVMLPGIFEQDLSAATLLAVPELYSYGQESRGFNMKKIRALDDHGCLRITNYLFHGVWPLRHGPSYKRPRHLRYR